MKKSIVAFLLVILSTLAGFASLFCVANFEAANTSAEIVAAGGIPLPSDWEVGVNSHGKYYRWYSKEIHPEAFAASVAGLVASVALFFVAYQINKRAHDSERGKRDVSLR